jgi:hypothetical protein
MNSPDMLCVPMAALDYIAELEAENAKLREALERIIRTDGSSIARDIARAALEAGDELN